MSDSLQGMADPEVERLIAVLDSLVDGEMALPLLIACGERAVPYLKHFLLAGPPRTIALPRCRVVHALGELRAYSTLISYFRQYERPRDAAVLFAEDAVRSAVARELLRWKSDEVFRVLTDAAKQRATSGVILAVGEFHRPEGVPLLFEILEDDLCREEAKEGLRKVPDAAHQYAILSIRGLTHLQLDGPSALRRRRATLQLLGEFGISREEWADLRDYLMESDADVVILAGSIGLQSGPAQDRQRIIQALFRVSIHINWAQEDQITRQLDRYPELAREQARIIAEERWRRGERPHWIVPSWRILQHVLGKELERGQHGEV